MSNTQTRVTRLRDGLAVARRAAGRLLESAGGPRQTIFANPGGQEAIRLNVGPTCSP